MSGVCKVIEWWRCFDTVVDSSFTSTASGFGCLEKSDFSPKIDEFAIYSKPYPFLVTFIY